MKYFLVAATIFISDLFIKDYAEAKIEYNKDKYVCKDKLIIRRIHNKGGARNIGENNQQFVAGFSTALVLGVLAAQAAAVGKKGMNAIKLALSFILGGGASNVYDRIKRKYVVDYVSFNCKNEKLKDTVFNISDFFIFIGVCILTLSAVIGSEGKKIRKSRQK